MEMNNDDLNEKGGALVEEAKRLMKGDEEEEAPREQENTGPKIKMSKIGGRKKKAAPEAATGAAKPYGISA